MPKRIFKTRKGRIWLYGIGLAVLPITVAIGLITEEVAVLWGTLLGAILLPGVALNDAVEQPKIEEQAYLEGYDEATDRVIEPGTGRRKK